MIGDSGDSSDTTAANITGPSEVQEQLLVQNLLQKIPQLFIHLLLMKLSVGVLMEEQMYQNSRLILYWALSFLAAPDYENPTDNGLNNEYVVVVRATDNGSNTSDQTVTVTVTDVDDTNPLIQVIQEVQAPTSTKTVVKIKQLFIHLLQMKLLLGH